MKAYVTRIGLAWLLIHFASRLVKDAERLLRESQGITTDDITIIGAAKSTIEDAHELAGVNHG